MDEDENLRIILADTFFSMHLSWIWHFSISSALRWKQRNNEQKKQRNIDAYCILFEDLDNFVCAFHDLEPNKAAGAIGYTFIYRYYIVLPPFGAKDCPAISMSTDQRQLLAREGAFHPVVPKLRAFRSRKTCRFHPPCPSAAKRQVLLGRSGEDSNDLASISTVYDTKTRSMIKYSNIRFMPSMYGIFTYIYHNNEPFM